VVLEQVSARARAEILPGLLSGEQMMCFGMSEPGAGSDAYAMVARAERDGDGWQLSGRKIWTTNAPIADYILVLAVTDPEAAATRRGGISAFLVPMSAPGVRVERVIPMFGEVGGAEAEVVFEAVSIEPYQLVGEEGRGFDLGLLGVSLGRVYNSARAIGLGRWALERALAYAKEREAFGHPIADYQGIAFPLAESAMELHAAHLMARNAAALLDRGEAAVKELSMAKAYAVQVAVRAIDRAIQTHGARGFTNELGLVDAYNVVRTINVADGTNEILKRTIFRQLAKGDLEL
jgi:acyl-CoA dehydrogenase